MLVAKYYNNNDIRLEELPTPQIGPGEILVKVLASGICGTDVMEWYRIKKAPRILGHEIAGEIVESKSDKYQIGQRVFVSHHVPCNACKYCRETIIRPAIRCIQAITIPAATANSSGCRR